MLKLKEMSSLFKIQTKLKNKNIKQSCIKRLTFFTLIIKINKNK